MSIRRALKKYIQNIKYDPKEFWNKHGGENYINKFPPSGERNEGIFLECNQPDKSNKVSSKGYWLYHNYHSLFYGSIIEEKNLNEINGDSAFLVDMQ